MALAARRAGITEALVARVETDGLADELPVRILNLTARTMYLPNSTAVAECRVIPKLPEELQSEDWIFLDRSLNAPVGTTAAVTQRQRELQFPSDFPELLKPLIHDTPVDNLSQKKKLINLLDRHRKAFSLNGELGHTNLVYHRIITGNAAPIKQAPRRLPLFAGPAADKCMEEMKAAGVIVSCEGEETEWACPIVMVKKKSGEWRFCIDFRRLNNVTKKSTHPLPRMDTTLDGLAGSTRFPFLDIKSAYWQVAVHPDD